MDWIISISILLLILLLFVLIVHGQFGWLCTLALAGMGYIVLLSLNERKHEGSNEPAGSCEFCGKHKTHKECVGAGLEYEAKFLDIDENKLRAKLKKLGAKEIHPDMKLRRVAYKMPHGEKGFIRVREDNPSEGTVSMTSKTYPEGSKFANESEVHIKDDFETGKKFLDSFLEAKAYQETMREKWELPKKYSCAEIVIDTIPGLNKYVEIECDSEDAVKKAASDLGFDYANAHFGSFAKTLFEEYGIPEHYTNEEVPLLTFENVREVLGPKVVQNKEKFDEITSR
jgi:adenylate cyclase, class 2